MSTDQKGFIVYKDIHAVVDELTDEQAGKLFRGMIKYFVDGTEPKFEGVLKFVFIPIKQQIDRDAEKYSERCEKNRENIKKRWAKEKNASAYDGIQAYTKHTNTNTNTKTNTKTDTDTTTNTNTNANAVRSSGGFDSVYGIEDEFNIWKKLTPDDVDTIYESYPNTGGDLIQAVYEDVKKKKKKVGNAVAYILGYADKVRWDDNADHVS